MSAEPDEQLRIGLTRNTPRSTRSGCKRCDPEHDLSDGGREGMPVHAPPERRLHSHVHGEQPLVPDRLLDNINRAGVLARAGLILQPGSGSAGRHRAGKGPARLILTNSNGTTCHRDTRNNNNKKLGCSDDGRGSSAYHDALCCPCGTSRHNSQRLRHRCRP